VSRSFAVSAASTPDLGPTDLTGNTSHSPFVVSASTEADGFAAWRAFDANVGTQWIGTNNGSDWLKIDLGSAQLTHSYSVRGVQSTAPQTWTLEGSNDGSSWTAVDTRAGEDGWAPPSEVRRYICATQTTAYRYFRLHITANNGSNPYTAIYDFHLYSDTAGIPAQSTALTQMSPTDLTSNTSHSPFVTSGHNEYYPAWEAFSTAPGEWLSTQLPAWLQIDLGTAKTLGRYLVFMNTEGTRSAKDWTMLGSNDGSTWDVLDTRSGELFNQFGAETRAYRPALTTTAYRYFRLQVTAEQGAESIAVVTRLILYQAP